MRLERRLRIWLLVLIATFLAAPWRQVSATINSPVVAALDSVGLTVSDIDRSVDFFTKVLSFEKVSDVEVYGSGYERLQGLFGMRARIVRMRLGGEFVELTEYLTPKGKPIPVDSRSNDRWFQHIAIIVSDMDNAYQRLRENNVERASTGPQTLPEWNKNAAGIKAFYFKDPDQHALEILWFPPDKGDPKWHRETQKLFLGIDHTAIVVSDTEASLRFYRDTLGLKQVGESENYGVEQEHLNNVFGARLRITALRAAAGARLLASKEVDVELAGKSAAQDVGVVDEHTEPGLTNGAAGVADADRIVGGDLWHVAVVDLRRVEEAVDENEAGELDRALGLRRLLRRK